MISQDTIKRELTRRGYTIEGESPWRIDMDGEIMDGEIEFSVPGQPENTLFSIQISMDCFSVNRYITKGEFSGFIGRPITSLKSLQRELDRVVVQHLSTTAAGK